MILSQYVEAKTRFIGIIDNDFYPVETPFQQTHATDWSLIFFLLQTKKNLLAHISITRVRTIIRARKMLKIENPILSPGLF